MKFKEVKPGTLFKVDGIKYIKMKEPVMKTCCEVKFNATRKEDKKQVKFKKEEEVDD